MAHTTEHTWLTRRNIPGSHVGTYLAQTMEHTWLTWRNIPGSHDGTYLAHTTEHTWLTRRDIPATDGGQDLTVTMLDEPVVLALRSYNNTRLYRFIHYALNTLVEFCFENCIHCPLLQVRSTSHTEKIKILPYLLGLNKTFSLIKKPVIKFMGISMLYHSLYHNTRLRLFAWFSRERSSHSTFE